MILIASFPRSGSHLTRFLIEYLTGHPTLGCLGNPDDVPISLNSFPGRHPLAHVYGAPIGRKVHSARQAAELLGEGSFDRSILILRDPVEALVSHVGMPQRGLGYLRYLARLRNNANAYFALKRTIQRAPVPSLVLSYERLISADIRVATAELVRLADFLSDEVLPDYLASAKADFARLRTLSAAGGGRAWDGIRSAFQPRFYAERLGHRTSWLLHACIRSAAKDRMDDRLRRASPAPEPFSGT